MLPKPNPHLSDEEISVFAEALRKNNGQVLSMNLKEHVKCCNKCAQAILQVYYIRYLMNCKSNKKH